jgi:hypothetical protein
MNDEFIEVALKQQNVNIAAVRCLLSVEMKSMQNQNAIGTKY